MMMNVFVWIMFSPWIHTHTMLIFRTNRWINYLNFWKVDLVLVFFLGRTPFIPNARVMRELEIWISICMAFRPSKPMWICGAENNQISKYILVNFKNKISNYNNKYMNVHMKDVTIGFRFGHRYTYKFNNLCSLKIFISIHNWIGSLYCIEMSSILEKL